MALVYAGASGASTSLALFMPQLVKSFGLTNWQTGLVTAVPFGIAAVWMILWGRSSDRSGERVWHNALPLAWMVLAPILAAVVPAPREHPARPELAGHVGAGILITVALVVAFSVASLVLAPGS